MGIETPTSCMGADHNWKNFLGGFFERTKNPQRIRSGQSDSCPPKLFAKIGKVRGELIRTLLTAWRTFSVFFRDQKVHRSAAYLWQIRSQSVADFWVRSGLLLSLQQVGLSQREKYTRPIRRRSTGSLHGYERICGGSAAD